MHRHIHTRVCNVSAAIDSTLTATTFCCDMSTFMSKREGILEVSEVDNVETTLAYRIPATQQGASKETQPTTAVTLDQSIC